jgi:hypothetical protein
MTDMWLNSALASEAELDIARRDLWTLKKFFRAVGDLTLHHDVAYNEHGKEIASVSPRKLGELLATINPNWYKSNDTTT